MTITLTREEAQQVLDALIKTNAEWKHLADSGDAGNWAAEDQDHYQQCDTAIETLRARLAQPEPEYRDVVIKGDLWRIEFLPDHAASVVLVRANYEAQPEPEPVADKYLMEVECTKCGAKQDGILTVNAPPQREWQGLTDDERTYLAWESNNGPHCVAMTEAKLREKNI